MSADHAHGEPLAREILLMIARERPRHLAFVRARMQHTVDAEDVLQLALFRAAAHVDEVREQDKVEAWFWRILRNTISDENERLSLEISREKAAIEQANIASQQPPNDSCACSLDVMQQLKPEYAELLRRADIEDESLSHIAEDLDISVNNATVRLHRARKAMRSALLAHCGTDSYRACQSCACEDGVSG